MLERFAEGEDGVAVLPVTVRKVEAMDGQHQAQDGKAKLRTLRLESDADIIHWWDLVQRYDRGWIGRKQAQRELSAALPPRLEQDSSSVETRMLSLLKGKPQVQDQQLPRADAGDPRPFEVVGIPLAAPGFYVVEAESPGWVQRCWTSDWARHAACLYVPLRW